MKRLAPTILFSVTLAASLVLSTHFAHAATEPVNSSDAQLKKILENLNNTNGAATTTSAGFSRDGIYGCTGAAYAPVGMQGPSGANVPVFDAATHDQIRLLTYKECVLDGIFKANREALIADMVRKTVNWNNTAFDGNPSFVENPTQHSITNVTNPNTERFITQNANSIAEPYRRNIVTGLVKYYSEQTTQQNGELSCGVSATDLNAAKNLGFIQSGGWSTFERITMNPGCNQTFALINAQNQLDRSNAAARNEEETQLAWNNGFRSVTSEEIIDLGGGQTTTIKRVVTPGSLIAGNLQQAIGTGMRQTENADEVDEIVSSLMSHIGVQILSDVQGFSGLSRAFSGQDSYVNRLVESSSANARGTMTDAGNSIVTNTIRIEEGYRQARLDSAASLLKAQRQLQTWESTCWSSLTTQAQTDLRERVETRICPNKNATNVCSTPVTVTTKLSQDALIIKNPTVGNITIAGQTTRSGSTVDVVVTGGGVTLATINPTIKTSGDWVTTSVDLATIPDGTVSVTATEKLANSGGTVVPIVVQFTKKTEVTGVTITLPVDLPDITVTATANNSSETATLKTDTSRSRAVINEGITPLLGAIKDEVSKSLTALTVLTKIKTELAQTASTSGQRFILENLDALVASRALHSESQMRDAQQQAVEIEAQMQKLLEETKTEWEAGWCKPENWQDQTK